MNVLDFGVARASTKRHQTALGVVQGTPDSMSPEQMYGHTVAHRSDIHCAGVMVFELLTLRRPFPVWDVAEMRQVFEAGPVPALSGLNPALPAALDPVTAMALAPDARDRWQTPAYFEEALRTAIARVGIAVAASGLARESAALEAPAPATAPAPLGRPTQATAEVLPGAQTASSRRPAVVPLATTAPSGESPAPPPPSSASPASASTTARAPRTAAPAGDDDDVGFAVSVVDKRAPVPLAPLPAAAKHPDAAPPRTQVLAQYGALAWSQNVGDDAELLAIARAVGSAPDAGRRSLLAAAAVVLALGAGALALPGDDLRVAADRAIRGRPRTLGTIVVEVRPPPDDVLLEDKSRGAGQKKITNVDVDVLHRLVVQSRGRPALARELSRADFVDGADGTPMSSWEGDPGEAPALPTTTTP